MLECFIIAATLALVVLNFNIRTLTKETRRLRADLELTVDESPPISVEYNVAEGTIQVYPLYGVAACNAKAIWDARTFFRFNSGTWYQLSTGLPAGPVEAESLTAAYFSMKTQIEAERVKSLLVTL